MVIAAYALVHAVYQPAAVQSLFHLLFLSFQDYNTSKVFYSLFSFQDYKSCFPVSVLLSFFLQVLFYQHYATMTLQSTRLQGHLEQRTNPQVDDTARTVVNSSKPTLITPRLTADSTTRTSIILFLQSNTSDSLGHIATPTTCPERPILVPDPLDSLSLRAIRQLSLYFRHNKDCIRHRRDFRHRRDIDF